MVKQAAVRNGNVVPITNKPKETLVVQNVEKKFALPVHTGDEAFDLLVDGDHVLLERWVSNNFHAATYTTGFCGRYPMWHVDGGNCYDVNEKDKFLLLRDKIK